MYARRTDANSKEIVKRLRELGCQACDLSRVAQWLPGFPDLLVCVAGAMYLVELKTERGGPTDDQIEFLQKWNGPPIYTLRSVVAAEEWVIRMRRTLLAS